jgi:ribosome-associated protein
LTSRTLAKKIAEFVLSRKGYDVLLLDLRRLTSTADFFILCSADSDTQVRAIADAVEKGTADLGTPVWHSEGFQASTWIILDYVDVVVHIFHRASRTHYNLERLWGDAKITPIQDTPTGAKPARKPLRPTKKRASVGKRAGV